MGVRCGEHTRRWFAFVEYLSWFVFMEGLGKELSVQNTEAFELCSISYSWTAASRCCAEGAAQEQSGTPACEREKEEPAQVLLGKQTAAAGDLGSCEGLRKPCRAQGCFQIVPSKSAVKAGWIWCNMEVASKFTCVLLRLLMKKVLWFGASLSNRDNSWSSWG